MKILIVSDTHRQNENFLNVIGRVGPIDMLIHCGDAEGAEDLIEKSAGCPVEMVSGNNDFFSDLPREREFLIGNYKVWLTHGHNYYVSMDHEIIKKEAIAKGADIVMYGHTHKPLVEHKDGIIAVNPGSLTFPRQEGRRPSYIILENDEQEELHFTICYL